MNPILHRQQNYITAVRWLNVALLIWMIVGAYLEMPLPLGDMYIPGIMLVVAVPVLVLLFLREINKNDLAFFGAIVLLTVISIFLSPGMEFFGDKIKGSVQTLFSIGLMVMTVKLCRRIGGNRLYWCFLTASLVVATGLLTEFLVPSAKEIFDAIRDRLYSAGNTGFGYAVYDNLARDIAFVGKDRASFLGSEPSVAAEGLMVFTNCCLALRPTRATISVFAFANFAGFFTTGSPILVLSLLCGFGILVRMGLLKKPLLLVVGAVVFALGFAVPQIRDILGQQIERFEQGFDEYGEGSLYSRIGFPYMHALPMVVERAPVFGVGVGGKQKLVEWSEDSRAALSDEFAVGTNAFVRLFLYYGIAGGFCFLAIFYWYLKKNGVHHVGPFFVTWIAYCHTLGSLESPRFWTYTGFFFGVYLCLRRAIPARSFAPVPVPNESTEGAPRDFPAEAVQEPMRQTAITMIKGDFSETPAHPQ